MKGISLRQFDLSGKHAVITGGNSGIGKSIARTFAENGACVHILDLVEEQGKSVIQELEAEKYKVIKEKRATFSQTPEGIKLRSDARTSYENLFLAGDWTSTDLPATIEGSVKSGKHAAMLLMRND